MRQRKMFNGPKTDPHNRPIRGYRGVGSVLASPMVQNG